MKVWGPGYCWSAWWWSLVRYLNVGPSPLMSTSHPPDVLWYSRLSPFFAALPPPCIIPNTNQRTNCSCWTLLCCCCHEAINVTHGYQWSNSFEWTLRYDCWVMCVQITILYQYDIITFRYTSCLLCLQIALTSDSMKFYIPSKPLCTCTVLKHLT